MLGEAIVKVPAQVLGVTVSRGEEVGGQALAVTGLDAVQLGIIAFALLLAGTVILGVSRRAVL